MSRAIPFSEVDIYLQNLQNKNGCIVDTNFLIALVEENHPFNEDAQFLYERLVEHRLKLFCTVTNRTEFIDFQRKLIITETLMGMLSTSSKWKISQAVRKILSTQKGWIDNQASEDELPLLTDKRIKDCKKSFLPKTQSGQIGWVEICKEYLSGQLLNAWETVSESLQLNYLEMRTGESDKYFLKPLEWETMYSISEETCLGSSDSMILNVLNSSVFPFAISADYDMAYGVLKSSGDKTILVPDALYRRHLKGLRF
jgi:hypothetical protein